MMRTLGYSTFLTNLFLYGPAKLEPTTVLSRSVRTHFPVTVLYGTIHISKEPFFLDDVLHGTLNISKNRVLHGTKEPNIILKNPPFPERVLYGTLHMF